MEVTWSHNLDETGTADKAEGPQCKGPEAITIWLNLAQLQAFPVPLTSTPVVVILQGFTALWAVNYFHTHYFISSSHQHYYIWVRQVLSPLYT